MGRGGGGEAINLFNVMQKYAKHAKVSKRFFLFFSRRVQGWATLVTQKHVSNEADKGNGKKNYSAARKRSDGRDS